MHYIYRDYQNEVSETALDRLAANIRRFMLVLPTGAGKTVTMHKIIQDLLQEGRGPILITVHKRELIDQLAETMRTVLAPLTPGGSGLRPSRVVVERAEEIELQEADDFDICIASIQTIQRRPEVLDPYDWDIVFIDETHRAIAEGYMDMLDRVGVFADTGPSLIGFTATDYRGDDEEGESLRELYDEVPYKKNIVEFIKDRWLVPMKAKRIAWRQVELEGSNAGAVEDVVVHDVLEEEDLFELVFDTFADNCVDAQGDVFRPTLGMVANVPQGKALAEHFTSRGVRAEMVYSGMPDKERTQHVQDFRDGSLDVLLGFNILIEGFDAPRASCLLWLRNTQSPVVFVQGLGRITRPFITDTREFHRFNTSTDPDERHDILSQSAKPDALFLDFADVSSRYNILTLGSQYGLAQEFDFAGKDVTEVLDKVNELVEAYPVVSTDNLYDARDIGRISDDAALWREAVTPNKDVPANAQAVWIKQKDHWLLNFPAEDSRSGEDIQWFIRIRPTPLGDWEVHVGQPEVWKEWYYNGRKKRHAMKYHKGNPPTPEQQKEKTNIRGVNGEWRSVKRYKRISGMPMTLVTTVSTKSEAFYQAELYVYDTFSDRTWNLIHQDAKWRSRAVTPKQIKYIDKMRREGIAIPNALDATTVGALLDLYFLGRLKPTKLKRKRGRKKKRSTSNG